MHQHFLTTTENIYKFSQALPGLNDELYKYARANEENLITSAEDVKSLNFIFAGHDANFSFKEEAQRNVNMKIENGYHCGADTNGQNPTQFVSSLSN